MEAARLHARLPAHRRAADRAAARVREAMSSAAGTWAVSCSGGKDSVTLLDVAHEAGWRGPVFHFAYDDDYDGEPTANARAAAERYGLDLDVVKVVGEFAAFDRVGHFFPSPSTAEERAAVRWWETTYRKQINAHMEDRGWSGVFAGFRKDESRVRRMMLNRKGHLYAAGGRPGLTCCPILDWSGRDVWARIASRGLPYLSRYDDASDRVRERSDDVWLSVDIWRFGMGCDIRRRNPALWLALLERYPALSLED